MDTKIHRFLNSIGLLDTYNFDLDFDLVSRNLIIYEQVDMALVKDTPWQYHLLKRFLAHLKNINYLYSMTFSYKKKPTIYDALHIIESYSLEHFKVEPYEEHSNLENIITFQFSDEKKFKAFNELAIKINETLKFINYEFAVEATLIERPKISAKKLDNLIEKAEKVIEQIESESDTDEDTYYPEIKTLQEIHKEDLKNIEKDMLAEMKKNYRELKQAKKDRSNLHQNGFFFVESISEIISPGQKVNLEARVFSIDKRTLSSGRILLTLGLDDRKKALYGKLYSEKNEDEESFDIYKIGMNLLVQGTAEIDNYSGEIFLRIIKLKILPMSPLRRDKAKEKRVELHLHTKMSEMDGVGQVDDYFRLAKNMGHEALAVTDHGVVHAFPDVQKAAKEHGVKAIYGAEFYMVDDNLEYVFNKKDIVLHNATYVCFDFETTGLSSRYDHIIEFGAVRFEKGLIVKELSFFINPHRPIPKMIQKMTGINDEMVKDGLEEKDAILIIKEFLKDAILVSHNADFDIGFLNEALKRHGLEEISNPIIDTLALSRYLFPEDRYHNLGALSRRLQIAAYNEREAHRALYDAKILNDVWLASLTILEREHGYLTHSDLSTLKASDDILKHLKPRHVIVLVKNKIGLKNLYKLITLSHINYFADLPRIPRHELIKHREGLLFGSACFNGEIFDKARTKNALELQKAMDFYDYIEVQPPANYSYLINTNTLENIEQVQTLIKDIISAAELANKKVVVTGDVHYVNEEDKVTRDIYIMTKAKGNRPHPLNTNPYDRPDGVYHENPDQHYRSTDEMLEHFKFLDPEKAFEIIVTNTKEIAALIEELQPISTKLESPKMPEAEEMVKKLTYETAHKWYGDVLPEVIEERIKTELNAIISNNYAVIYYIAYRIVHKANEDGYIVGSRGSVGSSLVATLMHITEVNPLKPHYRCPNCRNFEFNTDPNYASGYDLPDKNCPICHTQYIKDGQNIPFETFLGIHANKVPDIDLNFPSDYQAQAHDFTKVLLGEDNVFRAGTISTTAEKMAFGYVRGYFERRGFDPDSVPRAEVAYLAAPLVGVKKTTGQHPGGIMVIPNHLDVFDFMPVQYPADDLTSSWKTTHFDYRAIHDSLLKLDLLGHGDPLALKMMADIAKVDLNEVPLNDPKVLSLFTSDKALNRNNNFMKIDNGSLGVPEFGTDFVRGVLRKAKPKTFAELVIVSGLTHGGNVWANNAEALIDSKAATLKDVIGCRDDIMTYLMDQGIEANIAFGIMEIVRGGKKIPQENVAIMKAFNVPDYYIDSCNKISYMFPKAHAVAYVMQATRVGYFKVYYPLVFYAVFFSVRSKQFEFETMVLGEDEISTRLEELRRKTVNRQERITPKEEEIFDTLFVALEMYERGFKFANLDLYKSDATNFIIDEENKTLIPPFVVLDGLGESAAQSVLEARKDGVFTSVEDLEKRTKLNTTVLDKMKKLGVFADLPDSDQLDLFNFNFS
ncbi:MAG: PolC-type DNA polymerase III [Erysipelotrichia bacterium]|jgi:DNA polymerase-3 subunit alpha (Gram-positive type)|nr:PolC-type DNA polymerase III [Erysipelotrichia bacterium]